MTRVFARAFRAVKHLLEAGDQAPMQLQMELRGTDPIIRPLSAYTDFIRSQAPESDFSQPEPATPTEPRAEPLMEPPTDPLTHPPIEPLTQIQITSKKAS